MRGSPVVEIAEAVAEVKGVDPQDLTYSLEDYIDTEAIQLLTKHSGSTWALSFELPEYQVLVTSDGIIRVGDKQEEIEI